MDSNRVNLRTRSKTDPYQKMNKILQNPPILNRFHDFVILIGFCLFLGLCYGFESLKLRNVTKTSILGLKARF